MNFRNTLAVVALALVTTMTALAQGDFGTSLHATRAGKNFWYGKANGGFENFTNIAVSSVGCVECHGPTDANGTAYGTPYQPGCTDCHPTATAGFSKDSIKVDQCLTCHSRQKTESVTLGYKDVHRDRGFKCWDCHTNADMHGDGTAYESMLQPEAISVDCEDCHKTSGGTAPLPDHAAYDPHGGKIHCTACHATTVTSCYNCHFESQAQAVPQKKRAVQTLHGYVILANRDEDNKVYPMTFQSLTYQGNSFIAFGPFTSHTIDSTGRKCADCHVNFGGTVPAIVEYNATGEIYFAKWNTADSTLTYTKGIVPMPADYKRSFKMDFLTYTGDVNDAVAPSKKWVPIGENLPDGQQMFFAKPLTKVQMAKLGFDTTKVTDAGSEGVELPRAYELSQNYPNPFNPSTTIRFTLPSAGAVTLKVYNLVGQEVRTLVASRSMTAGTHSVSMDAADLPSGVYLYKLTAGEFSQTRKMALVK